MWFDWKQLLFVSMLFFLSMAPQSSHLKDAWCYEQERLPPVSYQIVEVKVTAPRWLQKFMIIRQARHLLLYFLCIILSVSWRFWLLTFQATLKLACPPTKTLSMNAIYQLPHLEQNTVVELTLTISSEQMVTPCSEVNLLRPSVVSHSDHISPITCLPISNMTTPEQIDSSFMQEESTLMAIPTSDHICESFINHSHTRVQYPLVPSEPDKLQSEVAFVCPNTTTPTNLCPSCAISSQNQIKNSKIRWTNLTPRRIAQLISQQFEVSVSPTVTRQLLVKHKYRRRQAFKKLEFKYVEFRNEQFEKILAYKNQYLASQNPIISIDTKHKEKIGNFKRNGHLYTTEILPTWDHDFPSMADGIAIPHGIYDYKINDSYIQIGTSRDTSQFAIDCLGIAIK